MKIITTFICCLFMSNQLFAEPIVDKKKPSRYVVTNLDKTTSYKKFDDMFSLCGGKLIESLNSNSIIVELSIDEGICVVENTSRIIIQIIGNRS